MGYVNKSSERPKKHTAKKRPLVCSLIVWAVMSLISNIVLTVAVLNFCYKNRYTHDGIKAMYNELDAIYNKVVDIDAKIMSIDTPDYQCELDAIKSSLESIELDVSSIELNQK